MRNTTRTYGRKGEARRKVTTLYHEASGNGFRTTITTWLDDAPDSLGGHPAGTVVTKEMDYDPATNETKTISETIEHPQ